MAANPQSDPSHLAGEARQNPAATLRRILALEHARGYPDRAVIGGVDGFLKRWREQLAAALETAPLNGRSYAVLDPGQRREWARAVGAAPRTRSGGSGGPRAARSRPANSPTRQRPSLNDTLEKLGIATPLTRARLERIAVRTLRDLLYLFPRRHVDYSSIGPIAELEVGGDRTVIATVLSARVARIGPPPGATKARLTDSTGLLDVTWFRQSYLAARLKPGVQVVLSGRVQAFRNRAHMENPEYEILPEGTAPDRLLHAGNLLPIYPATEGLAQRTLRNAAASAFKLGLPLLKDPIPPAILSRHEMPSLSGAVSAMHTPADESERDAARRRLAFEELFSGQIAVLQRRADWRTRRGGVPITPNSSSVNGYLDALGFDLTANQSASLSTVIEEIASDVPMGRLLQGEVGSGKTAVAVAALLAVASAGYQGALLAPTEVLAEQHFLGISADLTARPHQHVPSAIREAMVAGFGQRPVRVGLLIGSLPARTKRQVHALLTSGEIDLVIGTHALIQESVDIPRLALAVVDEQHRFGVEQRAALTEREPRPHLLCMTATPIPRSLALTLYGDLDLSTLRELPSGRQPVETAWLRSEQSRRDAYSLAKREVRSGRQVFVACPLIEPSDEVIARSATQEYERLSAGVFRDLSVGLLHGRMKLAEKQRVMDRFRTGHDQVLIATPVIEVGIDVPNATVMLIESADRFGLSQLHQLRGRVGRGAHKSYCMLLADNPAEDAGKRLAAIERVSDGFELAEEDLRLRGPGDYLGTRQSGFAHLQIATFQDMDLLALARSEAADLLKEDPFLTFREHAALRAHLKRITAGVPGGIS